VNEVEISERLCKFLLNFLSLAILKKAEKIDFAKGKNVELVSDSAVTVSFKYRLCGRNKFSLNTAYEF
jgi:hypothetical protein